MFSITDHNRFDLALYEALYKRLNDYASPCKAVLIPGVEFDIELQSGSPAVHVIAIFNAKGFQDCKKIENAIISSGLIEDKAGFYTSEQFDALIKRIKLDTVLIAHQHSGFGGNQRLRSLGGGTEDALGLYKYKYIDALEYNSSKVQGVLRGELADLKLPPRMLVGSDCHEWSCYPKHDHNAPEREVFYATIRSLPTFKGLLMALTSAKTRIGIYDTEVKNAYCQEISLCGKQIPLSPGVNVIIGENGSGKSSLLSLLCEPGKSKSYVAATGKKYNFSCSHLPESPIYIKQGDLQERYNNGNMFEASLYDTPDNTSFISMMKAYTDALKNIIMQNIEHENLRKSASEFAFLPDHKREAKTFAFTVSYTDSFANENNPWAIRAAKLQSINTLLEQEITYENSYQTSEIDKLKEANTLIEDVRKTVIERRDERSVQTSVKSVILNAFKKYDNETEARSSNEDRTRAAYRKQRAGFIQTVVELVKDAIVERQILKIPMVTKDMGTTSRQQNGFSFVRSSAYCEMQNCSAEFLGQFNTQYRTLEALTSIRSIDEAANAIPRGKAESWKQDYEALVNKFIEDVCKTTDTILDGGKRATGNTLGERALVFYKYISLGASSSSVFVADQPEDNISNQRIGTSLLDYLNDLRKRAQLIVVTHNPLLVINLDADNVIVLKSGSGGEPCVTSGCLESVDNGVVLQDVADIMDGGKEAIERRVKVYESIN